MAAELQDEPRVKLSDMRIQIDSSFPDSRVVGALFAVGVGVVLALLILRSGGHASPGTAPIRDPATLAPSAAPVAPTAAPAVTLAPTAAPRQFQVTTAPEPVSSANPAETPIPIETLYPSRIPPKYEATAAPTPAGGPPPGQ